MDGKRIQEYWSSEMNAMLETYKQFETLLPAEGKSGASHTGEDGRFVETLIKEYLVKYLPKELEVLTGFILRPAVKTGLKGKERRFEFDSHSTQLDLIVYNSSQYPIFQRFGDTVIVPPEGVIAIISIKKNLNDSDIFNEVSALKDASKLCKCIDINNNLLRGPFLALVGMNSNIEKKAVKTEEWIYQKIEEAYKDSTPTFDNLVGFIGALNEWSIFKRRPKNKDIGEYIYFKHDPNEYHLGFQYILTGILSVFYDSTRNTVRRPGFTAFPSGRNLDRYLGNIKTIGIR